MRERGWKWSQATVWAVEKGDRPLRLAEANDLAAILKKSVAAFMYSPGEHEIEKADQRLQESRKSLEDALTSHLHKRIRMAQLLDAARRRGEDLGRVARAGEAHLRIAPETVVREWRIREAGTSRVSEEIDETRLVEAGHDPSSPPWTPDGPLMAALNEEIKNGQLQEDS